MTAQAMGAAAAAAPSREEMLLASRAVGGGERELRLSVPSIHCGGCLQAIERSLGRLEGVTAVRANLTTKSVTVRWREGASPPPIAARLDAIGHAAHLAGSAGARPDAAFAELVRMLAVAGFASANIMAFSVSVWAGAGGEYRHLFHLLSAAIALPVLLYSGRAFYRSAWAALCHGRTNMDVPITIGVGLAFAMSFYDLFADGPHAYFDAAVMLLFFLLIGRTLDHMMRAKARTMIADLAKLAPRGATVLHPDGTAGYLPLEAIAPGMTVLVAAGERVPADGRVLSGQAELDRSLITGESAPVAIGPGAMVEAGTLNLGEPLRIAATATADGSFLAEMVRLIAAAEAGRAGYRRIADRAAGLYAPVVHSAALLAFIGWLAATGDWHLAATVAVAVLIITCPCALGLAVPIVQVIAARRLVERGIMLRDGAGLERLAEADLVVFDKTGTLTTGRPELIDAERADPAALALAAALAVHSRHPQAQALAAAQAARGDPRPAVDELREIAGCGIEARAAGSTLRLGRADWAAPDAAELAADAPRTVLARDGRPIAVFTFREMLRPGAGPALSMLTAQGLGVEIVSGDHDRAVRSVADALGVQRFAADVRPAGKLARLAELAAQGHRPLMVGDGLNDAPALARAHVSMAPASAVDVGRNAADFVFLRDDLRAVPFAIAVAQRARVLVRENFALAVLYNAIALPFAIAGLVTPLAAALAMSGSSLIVVANAMRLHGRMPRARTRPAPPERQPAPAAMVAAAGPGR
jgi:Cu2+-exporting ATPase